GVHVEREHDLAAAGMPRRPPGITIGLQPARQPPSAERNTHEVVAKRARGLKAFFRRQRRDPERRPRFLRRARHRGHVFEAVEAAPRRDLLLLEQAAHLLESLLEARATLIHRDAEA